MDVLVCALQRLRNQLQLRRKVATPRVTPQRSAIAQAPTRGRRQWGQAIVEMAVLLPICLAIAMVAAGGAQVLGESINLRSEGRLGAKYAAEYLSLSENGTKTDADVLADVQAYMTSEGLPSSITVSVSPRPTNGTCSSPAISGATSGICLVSVTLTETMRPAQGFFGSVPLSYTATAAI